MMHRLCFVFLVASAVTAQAAENTARPDSRYQEVMRAQYAARAPIVALRPEEAQRIYEAYLKTIGQRPRGKSEDFSGSNDTQSSSH